MTWLYTLLLLSVTFFLGLVVGESWAPISGATTQALAERCDSLEARLAALGEQHSRLLVLAADIQQACHLDLDRSRERRSGGGFR